MNKIFIQQFDLLIKQIKAEYLNAQIENDIREMKMHEHRLRNIKKVMNIIKKLDFEITDPSDLAEIPGIGKGTIARVKEILERGYLSEIEEKYFESLPPIEEDEEYLLNTSLHRKDNSRLSCQIKMTEQLDGMKIKLREDY